MRHDPTTALTAARVILDEKRGARWAQDAIGTMLDTLLLLQQDLRGDAHSELRRALARATANLRAIHGDLYRAGDQLAEALLVAERNGPVIVQDERLIARKGRRQNGADAVRHARQDRAEREASFAERERRRRERERQDFLAGRQGEGMRDNAD